MKNQSHHLKNSLVKAVLSLGIAFHFFCVLLVPSGQNYVGYLVAPIVDPYVKMLSIGSTWGFFAPDPGPAPLYIEYELLDEVGQHLQKGRWPDDAQAPFFRERRVWRAILARGVASTPTGGEKLVGPYLCRLNPKAATIQMWSLEFGTPSLLDVRDGKRKVGDEIDQKRRYMGTAYCPGVGSTAQIESPYGVDRSGT